MAKIQAKRYHDISCGHRVVGHEGKCRHLHGHNYRVHFVCEADALDEVGRVIDFSEIKSRLCMWLEEEWDHKFLAWDEDKLMEGIFMEVNNFLEDEETKMLRESIVVVPFNPTAENMAQYLIEVIGPQQLGGTGIRLVEVSIEETRKCSVTVEA
jgi:6-pyruvoyltetrahydropterin/6-carboxytetrahydropterin synthase